MLHQRFTVGDVEVVAMFDASLSRSPRGMFGEYAQGIRDEFAHTLSEQGRITMPVTSYLIRSAGQTCVVDTGIGGRARASGFPAGELDQRLREIGVDPAEVQRVVHTHLHVDHTGWNTVDGPDGKPRRFFPNARHVVQRVEWEYWMQPEWLESPDQPHLKDCVAPLEAFGCVDLVEGELAVDRHLTFIPTPGHTPGHVAVGITSAGERGVIVGDLSHHPAHLLHPEWSTVFDTDRIQSAVSRDRLMNEAADGGWTWFAGHWPFPGAGHILRLDGKRHFRAL